MLYLIRFDIRQPDVMSLAELREIWSREEPVATRGGFGIIHSFKAMGRRTVFAVVDSPDEYALDEALAALPIVEELGNAVEIELIPAWPFDRSGPPGRTLAEPTEEPEESARPPKPASSSPARPETGGQTTPRPEPPREEERAPVAEPEKPVRPEAGGRSTPREEERATELERPGVETAGSERPEDVPVTRPPRRVDTPGEAPVAEPEKPVRPEAGGRSTLRPEPPREEERATELERPEVETVGSTGPLQHVGTPGEAPVAEPEKPARPEAGGRSTPRPEPPREEERAPVVEPEKQEEVSITGEIDLLKRRQAVAKPPAAEPEEAAQSEAGRRSALRPEPPREEERAAELERSEDISFTGELRRVGTPGGEPEKEEAARPEAGQRTTLRKEPPVAEPEKPVRPEAGGRSTLRPEPPREEPPVAEPEKEEEVSITGEIDLLKRRQAAEPPAGESGQQEEVSITGEIDVLNSPRQAAAEPPAAEPEKPKDISVTGLIQRPDTPGQAQEPARRSDQEGPAEKPFAQEQSPAGEPEDKSISGLIRTLDAPDQEGPAREPSGQEQPPVAESPEDVSVTGMIRSLDSPESAESVKPEEMSDVWVSLEVQSGAASGEVFEVIGRAGATIGRSPDNSIQIVDSKVSRRHVRIEFKNGDYWLSDLGSSYGTSVNQTRLSAPRRLQSGDVIELGATRLGVTLEDGPADRGS